MNLESLLELDGRFSTRLRVAERPGPLRRLAAFLAHSGDSWFWLLGLGILWLTAPPDWRVRALVMSIGVLTTAVVVMVLKFTIRRSRPAGQWGSIYRKSDPHSFPSGHAARAAMLAVIALGLGPAWFGLLVLLWSPLVGLARVSMGVHYLSDVLAGMALGVVMGLLIFRLHPFGAL